MRDIFALIFLFPLAFFITKRKIKLNFYIKILSIVIIVPILASMHIILGALFFEEVHRSSFQNIHFRDFLGSLINTFDYYLMGFRIYNPYLLFKIPSNILLLILLFFSIFIKEKKIKFLLFFIILILFIRSFFQSPLAEGIFIGWFEILNGFNFVRVDRILPISYVLLFVLILFKSKKKIIKNVLYIGCIVSILSLQMQTPLIQILKFHFKKNLYEEKYHEVKKNIYNKKYSEVLEILSKKTSYEKKELEFNNLINFTFDNYYKFNDYAYLKQIVKSSRVMSVGFDPLIAVMSDIKVIDGYHTIYPLRYKNKFRSIIKEELEKNVLKGGTFKSSFDDTGSRVYAYYNDKNNILLNFSAAKDIGAKYIISGFPINNNNLKIVCFECNNSENIFLYEIL